MTAYKVAEGTQVNVEGVVHEGGSVVEVEPAAAASWLAAGLVVEGPAKAKAAGANKARKAPAVA